jgi:hypothetical protein
MSIEKRTQRLAIGLASDINMLIYALDAHVLFRVCPESAYSVEKLGSRGDPKILTPLQASVRARHEGTPSRCTRPLTNSSVSLDAPQARIDARALTLQENHVGADLEFFNRIGQKQPVEVNT